MLPETSTAPAPIVNAEVFKTLPFNVTVPVLTVNAVVNVAFVTAEAVVAVTEFPVHEPADPLTFPVTFAVIVPAEKLPYPSLTTTADAVFAVDTATPFLRVLESVPSH